MLSNLWQIVFGVIFGTWLVFTILFQFPRLQKIMRGRDYLYLLPSWSFFAPVPATSDFIIFLRFEVKGEVTPWKRLRFISLTQIPLLWDPERRQRKAIVDINQAIAEFFKLGSLAGIHFATPYLMLLQFASMQPERVFATGVQIMTCVRPAGQQQYELSFRSHMHKL